MPPEHEHMLCALCVIAYYVRRVRNSNLDDTTHLRKARRILLTEMRKLGLRGRRRVSLRVWHAAYEVLKIMRQFPRDKKYGSYLTWVNDRIRMACEVGLFQSKLTPMSEQTWAEQIAGRAALAAKKEWGGVLDDY